MTEPHKKQYVIVGLDWWYVACKNENLIPSESWTRELDFIQNTTERSSTN